VIGWLIQHIAFYFFANWFLTRSLDVLIEKDGRKILRAEIPA
jgi:hypothetical protein